MILLYVATNIARKPEETVVIVPERNVNSQTFESTNLAFSGKVDYLTMKGPSKLLLEAASCNAPCQFSTPTKYWCVVVFQGDEDKDAHSLEGINVTITEAKTDATMNKGMSQATAELGTYCLAKG